MLTYKDILSSRAAVEYREIVAKYGKYYRAKIGVAPVHVDNQFKVALRKYRNYLEEIGLGTIASKHKRDDYE